MDLVGRSGTPTRSGGKHFHPRSNASGPARSGTPWTRDRND